MTEASSSPSLRDGREERAGREIAVGSCCVYVVPRRTNRPPLPSLRRDPPGWRVKLCWNVQSLKGESLHAVASIVSEYPSASVCQPRRGLVAGRRDAEATQSLAVRSRHRRLESSASMRSLGQRRQPAHSRHGQRSVSRRASEGARRLEDAHHSSPLPGRVELTALLDYRGGAEHERSQIRAFQALRPRHRLVEARRLLSHGIAADEHPL